MNSAAVTDTKVLHYRAGFTYPLQRYDTLRQQGYSEQLDELFAAAARAQRQPLDFFSAYPRRPQAELLRLPPAERRAFYTRYRRETKNVLVDWFLSMADEETSPLLSKLTFFWHTHFVCRPKKSFLAVAYIKALRDHALGSFSDLLRAVAESGAMIGYLDTQVNTRAHPNENFARELLELFTLGEGNYTERDVKEVARAFTGWKVDSDGGFYINEEQRDTGEKTILGETGYWSGYDALNIILRQPACADFICRALYKFYVNPEPDEGTLAVLTKEFRAGGMQIEPLLRRLLAPELQLSPVNRASRIKTPIELLAGLFSQLEISFKDRVWIYRLLKFYGQIPLEPRDVGGWPSEKAWINNVSIGTRLRVLDVIDGQRKIKFEYEAEDPDTGETYTVQSRIRYDKLQAFINEHGSDTLTGLLFVTKDIPLQPATKRADEVLAGCLQQVEYQLC